MPTDPSIDNYQGAVSLHTIHLTLPVLRLSLWEKWAMPAFAEEHIHQMAQPNRQLDPLK